MRPPSMFLLSARFVKQTYLRCDGDVCSQVDDTL